MTGLALDHLVYGVPDLESAVQDFEERTGLAPVFGGRHPAGTANYLVGLSDDSYLEIIGVLPQERGNGQPQLFGLESLTAPRMVTWALRSTDLAADVAAAREQGVDVGRVVSMSRRTPEGGLLEWRMTRATPLPSEGLLPFLIDWGQTPHPADRDLPQARLAGLKLQSPDPTRLRRALDVLGVDVPVRSGPSALRVTLETPRSALLLS